MTRLLPGVRLAYGLALVLAPRTVAGAVGERPDRAVLAVMRLLGVRHLVQASLLARSREPRRVRLGAGVDGAHGASMLALAAALPRHRTLALASALVAAGMTACGLAEARCLETDRLVYNEP